MLDNYVILTKEIKKNLDHAVETNKSSAELAAKILVQFKEYSDLVEVFGHVQKEISKKLFKV
jgi:hypothetical protein